MNEIDEFKTALKAANAIIGQQADEMHGIEQRLAEYNEGRDQSTVLLKAAYEREYPLVQQLAASEARACELREALVAQVINWRKVREKMGWAAFAMEAQLEALLARTADHYAGKVVVPAAELETLRAIANRAVPRGQSWESYVTRAATGEDSK